MNAAGSGCGSFRFAIPLGLLAIALFPIGNGESGAVNGPPRRAEGVKQDAAGLAWTSPGIVGDQTGVYDSLGARHDDKQAEVDSACIGTGFVGGDRTGRLHGDHGSKRPNEKPDRQRLL